MVTEKSVVAAEHVDQRFGDHELMPRMEALLQVAGCKFEDLTQVACVIGPGGFMSLRVAVALANTLADQLQIPIAGVHLSEVYAARISPSPVGEGLGVGALWLHSTKKTELFVRGFGDYAKTWPVPMHVMLEDFLDIVRRDVRIARLYTGELRHGTHSPRIPEKTGIQKTNPRTVVWKGVVTKLRFFSNKLRRNLPLVSICFAGHDHY